MWKRLRTKTLLKHPRITIAEDDVQLPNGEAVQYIRYMHTKEAVGVLCIQDGKILLQQEYSYPPNRVLYQLAGGGVEAGEALEAAAKRELAEESGLRAKSWQKLGEFYIDNRRSDKKMHIFLAQNCANITREGGDVEEDITSKWVTISRFKDMINSGEIVNAPLLIGWTFYQNSKFYKQ
jgi:ADP-ribose pyrophosphatase